MTMSIDQKMMTRALQLAAKAIEHDEVPVGAVVYRGNTVLAEAHNTRESSSDPTAHAEILALREAAKRTGSWRLDGCSLAVTLEPCPMCAGALINARVEKLVYGATDPKMGCVHTLYELVSDTRFNHRVQITAGVHGDQCSQLLRDFFRKLRSKDRTISNG